MASSVLFLISKNYQSRLRGPVDTKKLRVLCVSAVSFLVAAAGRAVLLTHLFPRVISSNIPLFWRWPERQVCNPCFRRAPFGIPPWLEANRAWIRRHGRDSYADSSNFHTEELEERARARGWPRRFHPSS